MDILLGLVAALCWGVADYFIRSVSQSMGALRAQFYSQLGGGLVLSAYLLLSGEWSGILAWHSPSLWWWMLGVVLMITVASLAFFEAFRVGVLAIVSPIAGSFAAVTTVLSLLAGERFAFQTALGLGASLLGVALASIPPNGKTTTYQGKLPPGVALALFAAITYGSSFWILGRFVIPEIGGVLPIWFARLISPLLLLGFAWATRRNLSVPERSWGMAMAIGALATVATVSVAVGSTLGPVAVVTVLGSLSAAITVLLALVFLRERLVGHQWVGVVAALVGILLLST